MSKKFVVSYQLLGEIIVNTEDESDASDIVKGILAENARPISDKELIDGVTKERITYGSFNIDGDAIVVTEVQELKESKKEESS